MLRIVTGLFRAGAARATVLRAAGSNHPKPRCSNSTIQVRCIGLFPQQFSHGNDTTTSQCGALLSEPLMGKLLPAVLQPVQVQARTLTKFSRQKGTRKSVKAVLKRFYRLNWGGWIRTKAGRKKHLWKKSGARKRRLRQHVLVSGTQAWLLDKMVGAYWRRPKYYVDDPYNPYHSREEFLLTRRKPISH